MHNVEISRADARLHLSLQPKAAISQVRQNQFLFTQSSGLTPSAVSGGLRYIVVTMQLRALLRFFVSEPGVTLLPQLHRPATICRPQPGLKFRGHPPAEFQKLYILHSQF